jgi:lipopolysaccharide export system protein LptA
MMVSIPNAACYRNAGGSTTIEAPNPDGSLSGLAFSQYVDAGLGRFGDAISRLVLLICLQNARRMQPPDDKSRHAVAAWKRAYWRGVLLGGAILVCTLSGAASQTGQGALDVFHGFFHGRDQLVQIETTLGQARLTSDVAIYAGNIRVVRGDSTVRCRSLTVFYAQEEAASGVKAIGPELIGTRSIWKIEARGGVLIERQDQVATGEFIIVDFRTNLASLNGNVIATQGQNVLRGGRLLMDLTTGTSRLEPRKLLKN